MPGAHRVQSRNVLRSRTPSAQYVPVEPAGSKSYVRSAWYGSDAIVVITAPSRESPAWRDSSGVPPAVGWFGDAVTLRPSERAIVSIRCIEETRVLPMRRTVVATRFIRASEIGR